MNTKPSHSCMECGHIIVVRRPNMMDGLRCTECGGHLAPLNWDNKLSRKDGLTEQEGKVMDAIILAWNEFTKLGMTHPSDMPDFANGIHQCQQILGMRVLQRIYPEGYPVK